MTGGEDEKLMLAYRAGDEAAFRELYRRHGGRVHAFLRRRLAGAEEVDEVFQKVFARLHEARGRYEPKFPFAQWLFVLTRNVLLDHLRQDARRRAREERAMSQDPGPAALEEVKDERPERLGELTGPDRQAVEWRVIDELSYAEIARRLGSSEAGVRQRVSRALRRLRGRRGES